ncbi:MAG: diaminopimelate decarboxylase [Bdellovibrionales bacterium]
MYIRENSEWKVQTVTGVWSLRDFVRNRTRPFYFYDLDEAMERARPFLAAGLGVHYAVKANAHGRLLSGFAELGLGADVVSLGELQRALECGVPAGKVIFSGVAKDQEELAAALAHGILQTNVESFEELELLEAVARERGTPAPIALRVNIHLEAPTHKNIQTATEESKFGIPASYLGEILTWIKRKPFIQLKGLAVHVGSQIMDVGVFERMSAGMGRLYREVKGQGFALQRLDLGGGLGIDYTSSGEQDRDHLEAYLRAIARAHATDAEIVVEPGRFLVARMGVLLARVVYVKKTANRSFLILNAGMNALMRPALYQAYHRIEPVFTSDPEKRARYTVVGPICETTDTFAENREMPEVARGDWVAIFDTGAYGAVMANTYNESPLPKQWSLRHGVMEIA